MSHDGLGMRSWQAAAQTELLESGTFRLEGWRRPGIITYSVITQLRRELARRTRAKLVRAGWCLRV
jgi:hypothetical protein